MKLTPEKEREYRENYANNFPKYGASIMGMGTDLVGDPYPDPIQINDVLFNILKTGETFEHRSYRDVIFQTSKGNMLLVLGADRVGTGHGHLIESRFIHSPAKIGIGVGYCGTPDPDIKIGDYLVVEQSDVRSNLDDELDGKFTNLVGGTSTPKVVDALYKEAENTGMPVHRGKTISVQDFDSSNNLEIIRKMRNLGYAGIDMESAFNLQITNWHQRHGYEKDYAMIMLVSDNQAEKCDTTSVGPSIRELGKEKIGNITRIAIDAALSLM